MDVTVRYQVGGLHLLVIGEAKRHRRAVEREDVAVLHAKLQSLGAHKGVIFATSGFQSGALEYAQAHGIALVTVTEGRFTYLMRARGVDPISREEARSMGLADFVGHRVQLERPNSIAVSRISADRSDALHDLVTRS